MSYKRQIENTDRLECVHVAPWDIPYAHGTDMNFREWQEKSGAPLDENNLQSLCWSCHSRKSAQEGSRWGR